MAISAFEKKVYDKLRQVPRGKVITYSGLARTAGCPGAARAAGNALNKNPYAPQVPCHRVVKKDGRVGAYQAGTDAKIRMLKQEGVCIESGRISDFNRYLISL